MAVRILLLEDDESLADGLIYSLEKKEYDVQLSGNVREAKQLLGEKEYDLLFYLVLNQNIALSDGTGFEVCEMLRAKGNQTPIIFLTASDDEIHVIRGLDSGGDDYITKPFRLGELFSRIQALLRRTGIQKREGRAELARGDIFIDLEGNRAGLAGRKLELTGVEFRLLCLMVRSAGRVVTRDMILEELWDGRGQFVDDNTLSVYIRRLREKIEEDPSSPEHLVTIRGIGYCWE